MLPEKDDYDHTILGRFTIKDDTDQLLTLNIIQEGICINGVVIPLHSLSKLSSKIDAVPALGANGEYGFLCSEDPKSKIVFKKIDEKTFEVITTSRCVYKYSEQGLKKKEGKKILDEFYNTKSYSFSMPMVELFSQVIVDVRADLMVMNDLDSSQIVLPPVIPAVPTTPLPPVPK